MPSFRTLNTFCLFIFPPLPPCEPVSPDLMANWFSGTLTIPHITISFVNTDILASMPSSRFPLLSSSLHPRVKTLRRRPETSQCSSNAALTSLQRPLLHVLAVLLLLFSTALLLSQANTLSLSMTTTHQPQNPIRQTSHHHEQPKDGNTCETHTLPNPLASLFPSNATGVLNATLAIIPLPLSLAHKIIPPGSSILESAYRYLVPGFPEGMYPVLLQAAYDHDIQLRAYDITIEDFSRIGFEFPFLDLSGDGYSSYRWAPAQLISAGNDIAIDGSKAYGTRVWPARFEPGCQAYETVENGRTYFRGVSTDDNADDLDSIRGEKSIEVEMTRLLLSSFDAGSFESKSPYPLDFFRNITNQPTFAKPGSTCDNMIRFFDTSMSKGRFAPVPVKAKVRAVNIFPFVEEKLDLNSAGADLDDSGSTQRREWEWMDVYGVQVATPFIENNYLDCEAIRGYEGWSAPDGMRIDDL